MESDIVIPEYLPYPKNPDYIVYRDGRIYSQKTKKFIGAKNSSGHKVVTINRRCTTVQRIVLETFKPHPKMSYMRSINLDGDILNNNLDNLGWADPSTTDDAFRSKFTGRFSEGYHPNRILTERDYTEIYETKEQFPHLTGAEIGRIFRISARQTNRIIQIMSTKL